VADEELSPTLQNFVVLTWFPLLDCSRLGLLTQLYRTELWSRTLASVKPEIF